MTEISGSLNPQPVAIRHCSSGRPRAATRSPPALLRLASKFIAPVEQLLRNLALKSTERGAGGRHIAHSSPKADINGKENVIIDILASRHLGIENTCQKFIEEAALGEPLLAKNEADVLEDRSGFLGNTNFASQRVSNFGRIIEYGHFCCFFWCKQNYSKDDHFFGCRTAVYKKNRPARRSVFLWLMQNSG